MPCVTTSINFVANAGPLSAFIVRITSTSPAAIAADPMVRDAKISKRMAKSLRIRMTIKPATLLCAHPPHTKKEMTPHAHVDRPRFRRQLARSLR